MDELELIDLWNKSANSVDNNQNNFINDRYLKNTNIYFLKDGKVLSGRYIDKSKNEYIFLVKNTHYYSLVVINLSDTFPSEYSRIRHYSILKNEQLDIEHSIIDNKVSKIIDILIQGMETKFDYLKCFTKNVIPIRLHKSLDQEMFFTRPNYFSVPSMAQILQNNIVLETSDSEELTLSDIEDIFYKSI